MSDMQQVILKSFFTNEEYMRQVVPFMQPEYFEGVHKELFKVFVTYVAKYNGIPSLESFRISVQESNMTDEQLSRIGVNESDNPHNS